MHNPRSTQVFQDTKEGTSNNDSGKVQGVAILVFRFPNHSGQGTGNIMSGALAAQLLAEEFNRTLCHVGEEATNFLSSFRRAFELKDHRLQETCDRILRKTKQDQRNDTTIFRVVPNSSNTIVRRNYDTTSEQSECAMKDLLSNHDNFPVVYYEGNTYPRWPNKVVSFPRDYFHERFQPTQALLDVLPWKGFDSPPTVIHLREGDDAGDHREGLDDQTLSLLANEEFLDDFDSKQTIFLVTNNVEWYSRFPNWSHPDWSLVSHSALKRISWGNNRLSHHNENENEHEHIRDLQMWADWYTLLNGQNIYHTLSDFSRSAARWNEKIKSWTILGSTDESTATESGNTTPRLLLRSDTEVLSNESKRISRLVDRTKEELWFCGDLSPEESGYIQKKKDKQLLDLIQARKRRSGSFDSDLKPFK